MILAQLEHLQQKNNKYLSIINIRFNKNKKYAQKLFSFADCKSCEPVGRFVGDSDGTFVGMAVVGDTVISVGIFEGIFVGSFDGDFVGSMVGIS